MALAEGKGPAARPTEWAGVAGALAFLICRIAGVEDAAVLTALGIVLGFVPAAVTSIVEYVRSARAS